MASLWDRALTLESQDLKTQTGKPFTFRVVSRERIDVTVGSKVSKPIDIYCREFRQAEKEGLVFAGVRPVDLTNAGVSKGPSYVAGIINELIDRGL